MICSLQYPVPGWASEAMTAVTLMSNGKFTGN